MRVTGLLSGRWGKVVAALATNGEAPASQFIEGLDIADKAKVVALLRRAADFGQINNREKFKKVEADLWEFKSHQVRILCFMVDRNFVLLNGFVKKKDDIPPSEIERAKRIRKECIETTQDPRRGIRSVKGRSK